MLIYKFTYLWLPTMDLCYFHTNKQYYVEVMNTYIMEARVLNKKN